MTVIETAVGAGPFARANATPTVLWNDSADPEQLRRAIEWGAVGATCNPVIAYTALSSRTEVWRPRIEELARRHPTATESEIGWLAVEQLSLEGAAQLRPAFEASGGRDGRMSIQTDPGLHRDASGMVAQAVRFAALAPNMIVKIPATATGIRAIEEVTARGISVNATVSFTVPQAVAVGEAIERGLDRFAARGGDVASMGPVCTIMGGRLDDWLKATVARNGILVDPGILEWAGVAALKRAYGIYRERGFRSRILSAAFRNHLQWSELVGGDLVVSPPFDWQERIRRSPLPGTPRIDVPVPERILDELTERVPEFDRAYRPDGMAVAEFEEFGATRVTLRQFLEADARLDSFVRDILVPAP